MKASEKKLLERLSEIYPTIGDVFTEIVNLQSVLNLPKGTEHFITDIHGEYEAFSHVLRNGSGAVLKKIDEVFGHSMVRAEKQTLATLIYYPRQKMSIIKKTEPNMEDWYRITMYRLIEVCKAASSKYTRAKVRTALPPKFAYVIEELITVRPDLEDKGAYYDELINTVIDIGCAEVFIQELCSLIKRLVVDELHILGDIYDRGPAPQNIMDRLLKYHSLDIQWGNHDIVWMGAAAGSQACIATVIRNSARYGNLDILEDGYGINLLPLATFAIDTYEGDPCSVFAIKGDKTFESYSENRLNIKIHKAISIIQFKLEGQLIRRRPEFLMDDRLLLDKIDYEKGTITLNGKEYALLDNNFPTIDPEDPYALSQEEAEVMERLTLAFMHCRRLQEHMDFLLKKGNLYKVYNGNLMYHGCVPLNEDGSFKVVDVYGEKYSGRALYEALESYVRKGFYATDMEMREKGRDIMWYIWAGPDSPLFGKEKMATFERYFIKEKETHEEKKNPYYKLTDNEEVLNSILKEFGLGTEKTHIINGHVPVKMTKGEVPMHCGGKLLIIDGGFSKAYQKQTGIAGYTLIYNSQGLTLVAHDPFSSREEAIENEVDIHNDKMMVEKAERRLLVADTDKGAVMKERIAELKELLQAYRNGTIKEKVK